MRKQSFEEILAERQEYLDALKGTLPYGDIYALGFLETNFLYHMGDNGLEPLTTAQHASMARWKEAAQ